MSSIGPWEIMLILLVVLLVFGAKRIPEIARGLGKGIREFKDATNDIKRELSTTDTPPRQQIGQPQQPPYPQQQQTAPPPVQPYAPPPEQAPPSQPGTPPPAPPTEGQPSQS